MTVKISPIAAISITCVNILAYTKLYQSLHNSTQILVWGSEVWTNTLFRIGEREKRKGKKANRGKKQNLILRYLTPNASRLRNSGRGN